uniref:Integrase catalytic domain-containing protein n=1 Tax=Cannabis sativa TaxID=3483 RepID=A0A803P3T1_CANSA
MGESFYNAISAFFHSRVMHKGIPFMIIMFFYRRSFIHSRGKKENEGSHQKIQYQAPRYVLLDGKLYQRGLWCQHNSKVPRASPTEISLMNTRWPFAICGIDLIGSLPIGKGGVKFFIVAVDYFTKSVQAKPMNIDTSKKALDFVIKEIVCCYGHPHKIVSDNRKQFDSDHFTNFGVKHGIIKSFSVVARPQANRHVEAVNKILKTTLKKKLQASKAHWLKELPRVLWEPGMGVLEPNCEWTHEIQHEVRDRMYELKRLDGLEFPRAWNADHLH